MPTVSTEAVREKLDSVIRAMQKNGVWDVPRPDETAFGDMGAFGMHTMAFAQWLRWVFVPNVQALIEAGGPFPASSQVAVQAMREGDTDPSIAQLEESLRDFDALFSGRSSAPPAAPTTSPSAPSSRERACEWLSRAEALLAERRFGEARSAAQCAVAEDAGYPNAENFAGWVLLQDPARTAADLESAIGHFRRGHAHDRHANAPIANLADALLVAGRGPEAVLELTRIAEQAWGACADNWLGWYFTRKEPDLARALTHLRRAAQRAPGWGVCRLNLAWALDHRGEMDAAYLEYLAAIEAKDAHDVAFAHARCSFIEEQKGWLRNALRSMRRAKRLETQANGSRVPEYTESARRLEAALGAIGVSPPKERRDETHEAWALECERELPVELTVGRTESGGAMPNALIEVARKLRDGCFAEGITLLREAAKEDLGMLVDGIGIARRGADEARAAGHPREALELMRLVCDAYRMYASWATSGAEGLGRMHDVEQARAELARWERELG